jgi:hypothetical protein
MSQIKTWFFRVVFGLLAVAAYSNSACAQWRAAPAGTSAQPVTEERVVPVDWQQKVLKRPQQPSLQWQTAHSSGASPYQSYQTARRSSYETDVFDDGPATKRAPTPARQPSAPARQQPVPNSGPEVIPPGQMQTQFEPIATEGDFADQGGFDSCGGPDCNGDDCGPCGAPCDDPYDCGWELFQGDCGGCLRGLTVFVGSDAFKGPVDNGTNGNFGLNEGLNLAGPLGDPWGFGYQVGANWVQSNFSGAPVVESYRVRPADRHQTFITAGLFRRALCGGLQGGVAFDFLRDDYYQKADMKQLRSETCWVIDDYYQIGYYGAYDVGAKRVDENQRLSLTLQPTDMFVGYIRRNFETGGDGRIWAGATGEGDALVGLDVWVPLNKSFALESKVNYLIPKVDRGESAQTEESWGLTVQLVWYPGQKAMCQHNNPYRQMFNVADNSLFMVDRKVNGQSAQ